jgi:hypothetical protein
VSQGFEAIGFRFSVGSSDPVVAERLGSVLASLAADAAAEHEYTIDRVDGAVRLTFDDEVVDESGTIDEALAMLMWHINRQAVSSRPDLLVLHASVAEAHGCAILLPAKEESGKTTLVAGLVRAGMRYLTDEAAVLDLDTGMVHPYPKPLTVETGSWGVLADLMPPAEGRLPHQWLIDPRHIRPDAVAGPSPVGLVVSPRYEPGAPTEVTRLRGSETVALLVENAFNFATFGRRGLQALAEMVRRCDGYRLVSGDLTSSVDAVIGLADELREQACRPV